MPRLRVNFSILCIIITSHLECLVPERCLSLPESRLRSEIPEKLEDEERRRNQISPPNAYS